MSYNRCFENYQPYCYVENYKPCCHVENYQHPNVVENFDLFAWWPWMPRSKCSCPRADKKWYDMGSLSKGGCPKECRYKQCATCKQGYVHQTIKLKEKYNL